MTIVSTNVLENANVGRNYYLRLNADGGKKKKYIWQAFDENSLPPGIHLNPNGELRGTPTAEGEYQFKVSVFDGKDVFSKIMRMTVLPEREGLILRLGKGFLKQR